MSINNSKVFRGKFNRDRLPEPRGYFERAGLKKLSYRPDGINLDSLCPFHEDTTASFSVNLNTGAWLCRAGCGEGDLVKFEMMRSGASFKEAVQALGAWDETPAFSPAKAAPQGGSGAQQRDQGAARPTRPQAGKVQNTQQFVERIVAEAQPIVGTPGEQYLRDRGLALDLSDLPLLWHPNLKFPAEHLPEGGKPYQGAIIQRLTRPDGSLAGIHRTFPDGPRKLRKFALGSGTSGAVSRLGEAAEEMGIAEGLETALAAQQIFGVPMIAGTTAALVQQADVAHFEGCRVLIIFADADTPNDNTGKRPGIEAARALAERLTSDPACSIETVIIALPPSDDGKKADWLDVLNQRGQDGAEKALSLAIEQAWEPESGLVYVRKSAEELAQERADAAMAEMFSLGITRVSVMESHEQPEPVLDFVVHGLGFLAGTAGLIAAPGSTGKGFFTLQMAMAIANEVDSAPFLFSSWGADHHGQQFGVPAERGKVIVMMAEDPHSVLQLRQRRISHYASKHLAGITSKGLRSVEANLHTLALFGAKQAPRLVEQGGEVTRECETWIDRISHIAYGARLIVLDTLTCFHGADENSNGEMTRLIQQLNRICKNTGAAVLCTHHTNKAAVGSANTDQSAARGATALIDNSRWNFNMGRAAVSETEEAAVEKLQHMGYRVEENESSKWFIRTNQAKANYSSPLDELILRRAGAREGEHESGGVLVVADKLGSAPSCSPAPTSFVRERPSRRGEQ